MASKMRSNTSTLVAPQEIPAIKVALLLLPGFSIGEFAQIADVLTLANQEEARERFQWEVYGVREGQAESSAEIEIPCRPCTALAGVGQNLVVLGPPPRDPVEWRTVSSAVRSCHRRGGAVMGVGDAVEVLVLLGLLAGKRACAHWQARQSLSEHHHDVDFTDRLFMVERAVGTCAGASATIDLALDFVARLTSQATIDKLVCRLNCERRRSGQRSQRQAKLARFGTANRAFVSAIDIIQRMGNEEIDPSRIAAGLSSSSSATVPALPQENADRVSQGLSVTARERVARAYADERNGSSACHGVHKPNSIRCSILQGIRRSSLGGASLSPCPIVRSGSHPADDKFFCRGWTADIRRRRADRSQGQGIPGGASQFHELPGHLFLVASPPLAPTGLIDVPRQCPLVSRADENGGDPLSPSDSFIGSEAIVERAGWRRRRRSRCISCRLAGADTSQEYFSRAELKRCMGASKR